MLVGSERKFVGALIVPSFPNLKDWCRKNGVDENLSPQEMIHQPRIIEMFKDLVESFNKYFYHVEQVKKFELLADEWVVYTG